MKQLGCLRASMLLDRRTAGLSAAEALRLEEHLAGCEQCSHDAQLLGGLRSIAHEVDGTLVPHARARVVQSAFARVHAERAAGERARMHASLRVAAVLAVAAGAAFALRAVLAPAAAPVAQNQNTPVAVTGSVTSGDRVLSGSLDVDGRALGTGAPLASGAVLHASAGARIAVAHANVDLRANTDVRWLAPRTLQLDAGSVVADVDPDPHKPFVVQTARFAVMVLGTRFEVTLDRVSVEHGHVLVVAPDHSVLADLHGGESYAYEAPAPAAAPATTTTAKAPPQRGAHSAKAAAPRPDAAALIERARVQLGGKQISAARTSIDGALALAPEPRLRAEALTLRAECALVDGDHAAAIEAYLRVARSFSDLPAGENALYAAARLEAERQRSAAAAQLLERYLERYPHGRFEREARARLGALSAALDHAQ